MKRQLLTRGGFLLLTGVSIYLVGPSVLEVLSSWDQVSQLEPGWLILAGSTQAVAFGFIWALQRVALRTDQWFGVVTSQLAGNSASRILPGGPATGAAVQFRLLRSAGISTSSATSGMSAAGLLQLATTLALPLLALPALLLGGEAPESLLNVAWIGAALFTALSLLAVAVFADDRILTFTGNLIDRIRRNRGSTNPLSGVLLAERDALLRGLGEKWVRAAVYVIGRAVFDFLTLLTALAAFGSDAPASLVLLAFASASLLGMIPFTPGGLGFVEAGLTGMLTLAGVSAADAVSAALLYRLMSFWLPIPIGIAAGVIHRQRFGTSTSDDNDNSDEDDDGDRSDE